MYVFLYVCMSILLSLCDQRVICPKKGWGRVCENTGSNGIKEGRNPHLANNTLYM